MALTGDAVSAQEALACGLVSQVVPGPELMARAGGWRSGSRRPAPGGPGDEAPAARGAPGQPGDPPPALGHGAGHRPYQRGAPRGPGPGPGAALSIPAPTWSSVRQESRRASGGGLRRVGAAGASIVELASGRRRSRRAFRPSASP
ncbi:hypothetical protein [uncultured Methylobacterium sp.]|uniref:hypothetical protein n=1 Tax=Methylobacterium ajmalii TaxID=2738439 RepID=UPI00338D4C48